MKTVAVFVSILVMALAGGCSKSEPLWQEYSGGKGPGAGKKVVLISGDEEYRSEEAMPQLGKMLSTQYGFECVVLFAQDPEVPGRIDPNYLENIPGLEALRDADLMIISTRFRALPDEQMREIEDYLKSGKPLIGLRTATHAFRFPEGSEWEEWSFNYKGADAEWHGGFGQRILGTTWLAHHGWHKKESTRGVPIPGSPLVNGIGKTDIWSSTDVYGVRNPLPGDSEAVVFGLVLEGMDPTDAPIGPGPYEFAPSYGKDDPNFNKNDPMMPIAWTKSYSVPGGKEGTAFVSTLGASLDLKESGVRTLFGNAVFWLLDLEIPEEGVQLELVGEYEPTMYTFHREEGYWAERDVWVRDHSL